MTDGGYYDIMYKLLRTKAIWSDILTKACFWSGISDQI